MTLKNQIKGAAFLLIIFLLSSCQSEKNRLNVDISQIDIDPVEIKRYEQKLFDIDPASLALELKKIQPGYKIFLNGDLDDSLSLVPLVNYINDTLLQNLNSDCQTVFPDLTFLETELTEAFRYHAYYYPEIEIPGIYTYVSGLDYEYPVQLGDQDIVIALDMYLGKDYYRYKKLGLPAYMLHRFDKNYILSDCMKELAKNQLRYRNVGAALLDAMINEGKILWYSKAMIPRINDSILLNYTASQMVWAEKAEGLVWSFMLENELLYTKENQPIQKFIHENP
ncbi:MAG: hypothetical protein K8R74_10960, partial [Bacteroidales bacterium]|nr:hypothetical protein [Bacteroidales bacterium]